MAFRRSGLVPVVAIVLLCRPAAGLEAIARDVAVTRMLADSHGHKFAITFKPPAGRELDPRILNAFEISVSSNAAGADAPVGQNADGILLAESEEDPIDVSGYTIHVEAVSLAGCRAEVRIARSRPGVLKKLYKVIISSNGASSMSLVAFPTKGNVNVEIKTNEIGHCVSSGKPENTLDVATCTLPGCNDVNGTVYLSGEITNPRPYNVKFVGVATMVFVN
jgi:hypothetical protein